MKRFLTALTLAVLLTLLIGTGIPSLHAHEGKIEMGAFEMRNDGTVRVDDQEFKSMDDYLRSDYFKTRGKRCLIKRRPPEDPKPEPKFKSASDCTLYSTSIKSEYWPSSVYTIPVVFHVIYKSDGTGNISSQRIQAQMDVLNEDYRAIAGSMGANGYDTKIQFQLSNITRTQNDSWFNDNDERGYKQALGYDSSKYLNIYVNSASGYLGYSYLPQDNAGGTLDGVVVLYEAVGGRDNGFSNYDQGRTLVHEVGHYLGLLHTFEGDGCYEGYNAGDLIADTHSENVDHYGCSQTYTCSTPDDIHNYMNYTDDVCMHEFTREQANRMVCSLVNYRSSLYSSGGGGTTPTIRVTSPNGGESWTAGTSRSITWSTTGTVGNVKIQYSTNNGSSWSTVTSSTANDGKYTWSVPSVKSTKCLVRINEASDGSPTDTSDSVFTISSSGTPSISVNRDTYIFGATVNGTTPESQRVIINNSGSGTLQWSASVNKSWLSVSPSSGTGAGIIEISVNTAQLWADSYTGIVTLTDVNASNSPVNISVSLTVQNAYQDEAPFGDMGTPVNGSTVSGSIAVSGWALDDVQVQSVKIYNGASYIGDAVFVEDARPDVANTYSYYPQNYKAGWGYMLLTNFLPNGGNGTYTLYAVATDTAGHQTTIGSKTIYAANAAATSPFGALETPTQGGTASGANYANWGWALTPQPNSIPTNGSTISVWVDGIVVGNPTYNLYRADIASLFPGYYNSNGAVGYFSLDTTAYDNGTHIIQWTVRDSAGNTDGIGSRYFNIQNSDSRIQQNAQHSRREQYVMPPDLGNFKIDRSTPIFYRKGFNTSEKHQAAAPRDNGETTIDINEMERVEIKLDFNKNNINNINNRNNINTRNAEWKGFLAVSDKSGSFKPLPIGSSLDSKNGVFYWSPGAGFMGNYQLVFIDSNTKRQRNINIRIVPGYVKKN
jgi:hypothetical protein